MKKLSNEYVGEIINRPKGITLIALVITIVVLVIIAGVAINMTVGENGIIKRALQAREMQEAAEIKEKLELQQLDARISLGGEEITLDNYLKYLVNQGVIDEEDIEDTQESNTKTILVDDKYIYTVTKKEDGSIELVYEGKEGQLLPKIKNIQTTPSTNSITVKVEATRVDGGDYKFYIKDVASGEDYKKKVTNKTGEYEFKGLEQNKEFKIKVEVENKNGQVEKETGNIITTTIEELTQADLEFEYNPNTWTNSTITVTVKAKKEIVKGYSLQTSKDAIKWDDVTSQTFTENGKMYVRLYDGTNGGNYAVAEVSKIDKTAPTITISSSNVDSNKFTLNATVKDSESGLQKIEWYYKKSTDEKYTKLEDTFNGETTSTVKTREVSSIEYSEIYNAFARIYDVANNTKDSNVINISLTTPVAKIGNIGYSTLQNAIDAVPTNNTQTQVTLQKDTKETITVIANKNINMNLNGRTLTGSNEYGTLVNKGTLILSNGTIINSTKTETYPVLQNDGNLTINSGTYKTTLTKNCVLKATAGSITTINNGTFTANHDAMQIYSGTLNIINGTITSEKKAGIVSETSTTNITIGAGTIEGSNGVYIYEGTVTVNGGEITGNSDSIYTVANKSSTVIINDGEIRSRNTSGIAAMGTGTLTVTGGTIVGEGTSNHGVYIGGNMEITIKGGNITGGLHGIETFSTAKTLIENGNITGNGDVGLNLRSGTTVTIAGGTITGYYNGICQNENTTVNLYGGTAKGIIYNAFYCKSETVTNIGNKTENVDSNSPILIGKDCSIWSEGGTINFYKGILKGETGAYYGTVIPRDGYSLQTEYLNGYYVTTLKQ